MKAKLFALLVVCGLVASGLVGCKSEETPTDPKPPVTSNPTPGTDGKTSGTPGSTPAAPPATSSTNPAKGSTAPVAAPTPTPVSDKDIEVGGKTK